MMRVDYKKRVKQRVRIGSRPLPKAVSVFVALFLCVAMFDFAAAACLAAQPDGAAAGVTTKPAEKEMIHLNFPANLEAKVLIEYVSRRLGINILYDESVARKHITISSPAKIPKDSLLGLFGSALKMSGLMFIDDEQPGWKRIVPDKDLLAVAGDIQKGLDRLESARGTTAITQVFALKHVRADAAQQTVRPFLSKPGGNSFVISEKNLIVASDYAGNLRRISTVIELLDVPGPTASVRLVPVRHLDAESLAKQVTALLREKDQVAAVSGKAVGRRLTLTAEPRTNRIVIVSADGAEAEAVDLIRSLDVPTDAVRRSYRFRHISPERIDKLAKDIVGPERLKDRYKSVIDAESGLLIVTAPPRIHEHVESLVRELDVAEAEAELGHVRFYKLTNTTASNVLATIRAMESGEKGLSGIVPQQPESPRMKSLQEDFTGPNRPPPPAGQEAPKPPAYRPTSTAPADESGGDKAAPSVVTARTADAIVTVDTNTNTLIVIAPPSVQRVYKQLISMLDKRRPQVMVEVTLVTLDTSDSFSLGVDISRAEDISSDDVQRSYLVFSSFGVSTPDPLTASLALLPGLGFNGVLIAPDRVNIVIRALAASGKAKVISAPRMLVNDNATATLSSVSEAPFTSVNASETVSTTSFAGYASAGTSVSVTPHISEGDHLQLLYSVTLSSFSGEGAGGIPPPRQTNTLDSEVTVPDGYTVVVGGLTRKDFSETVSKIPLLGDIPILKYLVSSRNKGDSQSTLFAFIRPVILRDDKFEDLKYLSDRDLKLAGMPPNFPQSEPAVMQ